MGDTWTAAVKFFATSSDASPSLMTSSSGDTSVTISRLAEFFGKSFVHAKGQERNIEGRRARFAMGDSISSEVQPEILKQNSRATLLC